MQTFTIRPLVESDNEDVLHFWARSEGVFIDDHSRENLLLYIQSNGTSYLAETDEGQLVGFVLCGHDLEWGYVH